MGKIINRAKKQKIGFNYKVEYVTRSVRYNTIKYDELANMVASDSGISEAVIRSALKALQKQIVARERELNMRPVLPGFAGHVPPCITRIYPEAPLASLGDWAGFDSTCWCKFLDPLDPLYAEIQKKFIDKQTEFYGTDHI
ncbi:alpha-N-acetylglucosaminidase TIM-barrel domain-containing protein, partial [Vibrio sp. FNV 38]|nr:alpha-N-acetylglucosaminidase TIM-barrel domain-containing protein [Vibrio sp. FNV 38]